MSLTLLEQPVCEPVTLSEVKVFCDWKLWKKIRF